MMHAALVLAAAIGTAPPIDAPTAPSLVQPRFAGACRASIDPLFVRYVEPPTRRDSRNPLLWLIGPGGDAQAGAPRPGADSVACLRPLQVRNDR